MRKINLIVIHCSATKLSQNFTPESLEACHKAKGYKCCGYHWYITKDGQLHAMRNEEMVGAHARRYNAHSIGICYEGGLNENGEAEDTRTPAQKATLVLLLRSLRYDYPDAQILGHRDLPWVKKACPCFDVKKEGYNALPPLALEQ